MSYLFIWITTVYVIKLTHESTTGYYSEVRIMITLKVKTRKIVQILVG